MTNTVETPVSVAPATDEQVMPIVAQAPAPAGVPAGYISVQEAAKKRKGTAIAYGVAGAAAGAAVTIGVVAVTNKVKLSKAKKLAAQQQAAQQPNGISAAYLANLPAPQPVANPVPNANPQANQPAPQAQTNATNK